MTEEIKKIIYKPYINNASDIISFLDIDEIKSLFKIKCKKVIINSHLIHKEKEINLTEQLIFNLDNYITFVKNKLTINQFEIKYIIDLTLRNSKITHLISNIYYYDNIEYYNKIFKEIFMYQYKKNIKYINKHFKVKEKSFNEFINHINTNKKRAYVYFEDINKNKPYYLELIKHLENII